MNRLFFLLVLTAITLYLLPLSGESLTGIEVRSAAFFPSSKLFRKIYGNIAGDYQIEASTKVCSHLHGWINYADFSKKGKSKPFGHHTKVTISNFSFGVKFPYPVYNRTLIYAGIGASFSKVHIHNQSEHLHQKTSKFAFGGVLKTGLNYFITSNLYADLFLDYLYQPVHFQKTVDVGGFKAGLGIGCRF